MRRIDIPRETLEELHVNQWKSSPEIAEILGVSKHVVSNRISEYGLNRGRRRTVSREVLYDLHYNQKMTLKEIATQCGLKSTSVLVRCMKEYGFKTKLWSRSSLIKDIPEDKLDELYTTQHKPVREIAEHFNCDVQTINNYRNKHGISERHRFGMNVVPCDINFPFRGVLPTGTYLYTLMYCLECGDMIVVRKSNYMLAVNKYGHYPQLCEYCSRQPQHNLGTFQKKHTLEILQGFADSHGGICLAKEYLGYHKMHSFFCDQGHMFEITLDRLQKGYWCPKCNAQPKEGFVYIARVSTEIDLYRIGYARDEKNLKRRVYTHKNMYGYAEVIELRHSSDMRQLENQLHQAYERYLADDGGRDLFYFPRMDIWGRETDIHVPSLWAA